MQIRIIFITLGTIFFIVVVLLIATIFIRNKNCYVSCCNILKCYTPGMNMENKNTELPVVNANPVSRF